MISENLPAPIQHSTNALTLTHGLGVYRVLVVLNLVYSKIYKVDILRKKVCKPSRMLQMNVTGTLVWLLVNFSE